MSDTVGNVMKNGKDDAFRAIVLVFGVIVYIAGIIYAEVHGFNLMKQGISPNLLIWATVGIVALGISALVLPIGLHYSFHDDLQRIAAYAFYFLDMSLMIFNAIADFGWNTGETLPTWLEFYRFNIMPATPLFAAVGWSILALLDPSQMERSSIEQLKAATRKVIRNKIADKAHLTNVDKAIEQAAETMAFDVIDEVIGHSLDRTRRKVRKEKQDDLILIARDVINDKNGTQNNNGKAAVFNQETAAQSNGVGDGPNFIKAGKG